MKIRYALCIILPAFLAACGGPAAPRHDRTEGAWQVMVDHPGTSSMLCYTGSVPVKSTGLTAGRPGKPYLMATRRPSGKIEISASAGYPFLQGGRVELMVDKKAYGLFFTSDVAWAENDAEDREIVEAMKTADTVELLGISQARQTSTDIYSATGFDNAVIRIRELCP